ncbi:MAG: tRNA (adenosine(37)-N6)-threonylcarbamoyltransferase complex transferase subunit TsaD [candidate division NC10 bacterium]|nr:tRNA (adenosine(37)-N6)-threonylcarbamoyltransferase complex transferase subunit TsaD [candidate division NC10 bacterium]
MTLVLGIETSCDETAAAVLEDGRRIRSNVVASQVEVHAPYGGIVPELASRRHLEVIHPVLDRALADAGVGLEDLAALAVTVGPGLVGSLLVGVSVAKAIAFARHLPLVGVNHLEGHIAAAFLESPTLTYPFAALVVSGGHTHLCHVPAECEYRLLGRTRDDAAGEAFDKVAKLLGLGYPGGPAIEREAQGGDPRAIPFPRAVFSDGSLDFSFSGLKTAVVHCLRDLGRAAAPSGAPPLAPQQVRDVCASFQQAAVDMLVERVMRAVRDHALGVIVVAGGVACNGALRQALKAEAEAEGIQLVVPSPALCTDNAAMIAAAGAEGSRPCGGRVPAQRAGQGRHGGPPTGGPTRSRAAPPRPMRPGCRRGPAFRAAAPAA